MIIVTVLVLGSVVNFIKSQTELNELNQNTNRLLLNLDILNHSKTVYLNIDRVSILHCLFNKQLVISLKRFCFHKLMLIFKIPFLY